MNIQQAVVSGKPFRRGSWPVDYWFEVVNDLVIDRADGSRLAMKAEDYLADDWIVKEPTVTITASQFWAAWDWAVNNRTSVPAKPLELARLLAKRLGLEAP